MGSFGGHLLPGSFFLAFSIYWCFQQWKRYYSGVYHLSKKYRASVSYPCDARTFCGRFHWEGILKFSLCSIGLILEIITGWTGTSVGTGNMQHVAMYSFFGFSGIIDILLFYKVPIPKNSDYVIAIFSFAVEGLLFQFHLHGRYELDTVLHKLLVYTIWFCVLIVVLEVKYPLSILISQGRCFGVALQGTWFIQVGFMLFPPFSGMKRWVSGDPNMYVYDEYSKKHSKLLNATTKSPLEEMNELHRSIMLAVIIFVSHILLILLAILTIGLLVNRYYSRYRRSRDCAGDRGRMERLMEDDIELSDLEDEEIGLVLPKQPNGDSSLHG